MNYDFWGPYAIGFLCGFAFCLVVLFVLFWRKTDKELSAVAAGADGVVEPDQISPVESNWVLPIAADTYEMYVKMAELHWLKGEETNWIDTSEQHYPRKVAQ